MHFLAASSLQRPVLSLGYISLIAEKDFIDYLPLTEVDKRQRQHYRSSILGTNGPNRINRNLGLNANRDLGFLR